MECLGRCTGVTGINCTCACISEILIFLELAQTTKYMYILQYSIHVLSRAIHKIYSTVPLNFSAIQYMYIHVHVCVYCFYVYSVHVMIPVIDLGCNNTPKVHFSFAGFVHASCSGARVSVLNAHNAFQCHVIIM